MPKQRSVARRVFTTLVLLFSAVIALVAFALYFTVTGSVESAVLGNVTRDMALAASDLESWLAGKLGALATIQSHIQTLNDQPALIHTLLTSSTQSDPDVAWMYYGTAEYSARNRVVLADGFVRSGGYYMDGSGWTPEPDWDWRKRPWFAQALLGDRAFVSSPYTDAGTGDQVVSISLACRLDGRLLGVLAADVRLASIESILPLRRFTSNASTYLVDRAGAVIARLESGGAAVLGVSAFSASSPLDGMRGYMNSVERTSGFLPKHGLYYASSRVDGTDWLILGLGPIADVGAPVFDFFRALIAISMLALVAAIILAVLESKAISRPVEALKRGALALAAGQLDYRVDLKSGDEFGELADFFNHVAESLSDDMRRMEEQRSEIERYSQTLERAVAERTRKLNEAYTLLRRRNDEIEEEVLMAAAVQRKIIPDEDELPRSPALSFGARYQAMANVGGDLYDAIDLGSGRFAFVVGDVSGHGIPAALVAAMAKVSFRAHALRGWEPSAILAEVNSELCELIGGETYFVSAFLAVLDVSDGSLFYASAGHPPALLRRLDGSVEELETPDGMLLGITEDFPRLQSSTAMSPGDRLVLYTDGIIEARSSSGRFYETAGLSAFLTAQGSQHPAAFVSALLDDVSAFAAGTRQSDDRAVLAVGFKSFLRACSDRHCGPEAIMEQALELAAGGSARDASALLEELRLRHPDDPRVMSALAGIRLKLGDAAGAERLLRTAVRLAPTEPAYAAELSRVLAVKDE
ncbi:MAG: SpoIIE family protein phosphatase [Spirochaetia bacterium]|nr:SpoIIE family protein phosphatase [Spirochaetia bacterium]